jgi:pSer/pThr/pTyr-binding forkhead associated (FHA) protein
VPRYRLAITGEPGSGRELDLDEPLEIGRDPSAGLVLADDLLVSRRHARLVPGEDGVQVEDLGSRNGTLLNGVRLTAPALARPGDTIVVGGTSIEVQEPPHPGYLLLVRAQRGVQVPLSAPVEVGRSADADVALVDDQLVSTRHTRLMPSRAGVLVEDLGSRNGTFVNGLRVVEPVLAQPGDRVLIGETELEIRDLPRPAYVLAAPAGERPEIVLVEPLEIGRDPAAGLSLPEDQLVSFRHARVTPAADGPLIEDLGSSNGTFVNGVRLTGPTQLRVGDRIVVGATQLELRSAAGADRPTLVRTPAPATAESPALAPRADLEGRLLGDATLVHGPGEAGSGEARREDTS